MIAYDSTVSGIATWQERECEATWDTAHDLATYEPLGRRDDAWDECLNSLITAYEEREERAFDDEIICEIAWMLCQFKKLLPDVWPLMIIPDPDGGLVAELRDYSEPDDVRYELTVLDDGEREITVIRNGKIVDVHDLAAVSR